MNDSFDDDLSAAYERLVTGVEAPVDAASRVARRRVQRRRRRTALAGLASLITLAAVGIGGALVLGGDPDPQGEVAVDPTPPGPSSVALAETAWPTEVTCADGKEPRYATVDAPRAPLIDVSSGLGPVHFDRERSRLLLLRPDRSAHAIHQFFPGAAGMAQLSFIEDCGEPASEVSTDLDCAPGEQDAYLADAQPQPNTSAIEVAETWSGGNLVSLSKDGSTAYALRPDGTTYAVLGVSGSRDAHAVTQTEFCVGEGPNLPTDPAAGDWPTSVTCPTGTPTTALVYSVERYSTLSAFLRGQGTGAIHHSADRTSLSCLRPDGTAYRKVATQGASGGWNPSKITACDFAERITTPAGLRCPGSVVSRQFERFTSSPYSGLSRLEAAEVYSNGRPVALASDRRTALVIGEDGSVAAELDIEGTEEGGFAVGAVSLCEGDPLPDFQG